MSAPDGEATLQCCAGGDVVMWTVDGEAHYARVTAVEDGGPGLDDLLRGIAEDALREMAVSGPTADGDGYKRQVIETVAREYLAPLRKEGVDTLILGCTHYPLLADVIGGVMGPGVELVSAGEESAFELKRMLKARGLRADENRRGETEFYVSDRVEEDVYKRQGPRRW